MIDAIDRADLLLCEVASVQHRTECSGSVTSQIFTKSATDKPVQSIVLPQGLSIVRGLVSEKFSVRVLAYLAEAEQKTEVATEQQCYRIAWLTVLRADEGDPDPWRTAFWQIVGNTPEKAIPFWLCRDDLMQDEFVPLNMVELRYTSSWGSDYVRAKMAANAAREALPPKKPVEFAPLPFPVERKKRIARRGEHGFSSWSPIAICTFAIIAVTLWIAGRTSKTYFYNSTDQVLRVIKNVDPCESDGTCGYRRVMQSVSNGVPNPETQMTFCEKPRFEQGQTFSWARLKKVGGCWAIDGWDLVRENGFATLAPNCKPDYSQATIAGHIACEGGKARF